ncbi:hypothetical protein M407DRAFT_89091 [Tulasnella calospora MUT 4182]|uniref:Uncharacterized protein n=1 Tax=Tulasnella calospora MUT 4182 TaxID=1051891 RepID=A0A0C3LKL0_9AGAM|nr:hypothetical protein M407DRAFT_89091 [Tulasnella calospora MUT 4182]
MIFHRGAWRPRLIPPGALFPNPIQSFSARRMRFFIGLFVNNTNLTNVLQKHYKKGDPKCTRAKLIRPVGTSRRSYGRGGKKATKTMV